ncbi:MAG TPA: hypothetical protein DEH78_23920 [Solibacterales bacterium]|nr:hypothetical protein [Bryobacterales bacterium]
MLRVVTLGALLAAAPLFSGMSEARDPRVARDQIVWFQLTESREQAAKLLGAPSTVAHFGTDFISWQYQGGDVDHHEYSHQLVFRKSDGKLASVTRNYEPGRNVDPLFPARVSSVHHFPNAEKPQLSLRLRRLPGGRVLMAMGSPKPGSLTTQLVLMREDDLPALYPWIRLPERNAR